MVLTSNDYGYVIHVTGTTDAAESVSTNFMRLVGILWYAPTTADHLLSVTDKNGQQVVKGKCVTAKASSWWDLDGMPVNGIKINDMDSGEVFIMVKRGRYQAS